MSNPTREDQPQLGPRKTALLAFVLAMVVLAAILLYIENQRRRAERDAETKKMAAGAMAAAKRAPAQFDIPPRLPYSATDEEITDYANAAASVVRGYYYTFDVMVSSDAPWTSGRIRVKKYYKGEGGDFLDFEYRRPASPPAAYEMPKEGIEYLGFITTDPGQSATILHFLKVDPHYVQLLDRLFPNAQTQPSYSNSDNNTFPIPQAGISDAAANAQDIFLARLDSFWVSRRTHDRFPETAQVTIGRRFKGEFDPARQFACKIVDSSGQLHPLPEEGHSYIFFITHDNIYPPHSLLILNPTPEAIKLVEQTVDSVQPQP